MTRHALRPYQAAARDECDAIWQDEPNANILVVKPTGAGKTVFFSDRIASTNGATVAIAHRQELVSQISLALAREEVRHRIIGPDSVQRACASIHMHELGANYVNPRSSCAVAGVDTLVRRSTADPWFQQVRLWVCDEAHHLLRDNKWGAAAAMFPNARGLGVTATPTRADGRGLGRHADGVFDHMIVGPTMRDLIEAGYLTDYRIYAPPSDLDLSGVTVTASGDYSPEKLRKAVHKSHIVGDVVEHYLRIAPGKLGVTFAVDVESATAICQAYRAAGVPAEVVTATTPDLQRAAILRRFRAREVLQLVNVDLFGEGFDLPAIEVVSMARPTQSYALFAQQFGRALRILPGKERAIIIDHAQNVMWRDGRVHHGLPDAPRVWTLNRRERRAKGEASDVIPVRACPACTMVYERVHAACPYCGHKPEPAGRGAPEQVDGDLAELSPAVLEAMRGAVATRDKMPNVQGWSNGAMARGQMAIWRERREAQAALRGAIALYAGWRKALGDSDSMRERRFFHTFGVDVLTAQTLKASDAAALREKVDRLLAGAGVVAANGSTA